MTSTAKNIHAKFNFGRFAFGPSPPMVNFYFGRGHTLPLGFILNYSEEDTEWRCFSEITFLFCGENRYFSPSSSDGRGSRLFWDDDEDDKVSGRRSPDIIWKEMGEIFPILFYNILIFSSDMVLLASNGFVICNLLLILAKSTTYTLITTWRLTTYKILFCLVLHLSEWTLTLFGWANS